MDNISSGPYYILNYYCYSISYTYITLIENYHDGTVAYFIKLEFITKLAWALYLLIFTKSLNLPLYFMFSFSIMNNYMV